MCCAIPCRFAKMPAQKLLAPGMEGLLHEGECYSDWLASSTPYTELCVGALENA